MSEKMSSELTRQELFDGTWTDKYGRLRSEQGKFLPMIHGEDVEIETNEDVHEWYLKWWGQSELKQVSNNEFLISERYEPILSDAVKEVLCFIGIITICGVGVKLVQCLF